MKQLNVLIVEDEEYTGIWLESILKQLYGNLNILGIKKSVVEARNCILKQKPDVLFLDVKIKDGTGFEVLDGLKQKVPYVIFTTAYEEYAIRAIKNRAFDYILKPVDELDLKEAINKIYNHLGDEKKYIVRTQQGITVFEKRQVYFIKAERSYSTICHENGSILVSKPLRFLKNEFDFMIRVHRSYLINLEHVATIRPQTNSIILINEQEVPYSATYRRQLIELIKHRALGLKIVK